jgi:hypothetical protein
MISPSSSIAHGPDQRAGLSDRRILARDPSTDRRMGGDRANSPSAEQVHMRPPTEAGEGAPASENTSLLFERS